MATVKMICEKYGGDSAKVFLAGFSRGSIACNYIGLHNNQIASLTAESPAVKLEARDQLYDIVVSLKQGTAKRAVLAFGADRVTYDFAARRLEEMPLDPDNGTVAIRVLIDRPMFEVVGGQGACCKTSARSDAGKPLGMISLTAEGGELAVESMAVHEMKSIWKDK